MDSFENLAGGSRVSFLKLESYPAWMGIILKMSFAAFALAQFISFFCSLPGVGWCKLPHPEVAGRFMFFL